MRGFGEEQKSKKKSKNATKPSKEKIIELAIKADSKGNIKQAVDYYKYFINQGFEDHRVFSNYGKILKNLGHIKEALFLYRKAIQIKPDFAEAHSNLGILLNDLGHFKEAVFSYSKAIQIKPDLADVHSNLGNTLRSLGKLKEAEFSYRKAIQIKPDFAEAHSNLGILLNDLDKLEEAVIFTRKAIELKPDHADAYLNLGIILSQLNNLKEAELSINKSIELKPSKLAYFYYAHCLFKRKSLDEAKKNLNILKSLNGNSFESWLLAAAESGIIFAEKKSTKQSKFSPNKFNRLILNRKVENELVSYLYTLKNRQLDITKDARYGGGLCSTDFTLFEDNSKIISNLANDLREICKKELDKKEIIICDSFFNIFVTGCGAEKHNHITGQDKIFDLHLHKYSLVYYLDIGDQKGEDPGFLKLYEPDEEILPTNGMIVIIDGQKNHSVSYKGNKDRVMIGVNFYGF